MIWRADEVQLVTAAPLARGALRDVSWSQDWWATLNAFMTKVADEWKP